MSQAVAYLIVFLAAAFPWLEVLIVIPAGILAGLAPVPTTVIGAAGNVASLVPVIVAGDRLRSWWRRRRTSRDAPRPESAQVRGPRGRNTRAAAVFQRFGLPGLALLGPLLTGSHVAVLMAMAGGASRRATFAWIGAGVVVWSVIAAVAAVVGIDWLVDPDRLPDLFEGAMAAHP